MTPQVTLVVRVAGNETERLIAHLQRELAEEAGTLADELPPVEGTTIGIEFRDGRRGNAAEHRVRQALDAGPGTWRESLEFAPTLG